MTIRDLIFERTSIPLLSKGLDAFSRRQRAISHNLANIETPEYHRRKVHFEDDLKKILDSRNAALKVTSEGHLPFTTSQLKRFESWTEEDIETPPVNGVNNVQIDQEMADLATNNLQYQATSKIIRQMFDGLKNAIRGGGAA